MQRRFSSLSLFAASWLALTISAQGQQPVAFPIDWDAAERSVVDLSDRLVKPAGKYGFVHADGEHLFDEAGHRIRMWGINLGGPNGFPTHEQAERLSAIFARLGINVIRFHGMDSNWGKSSIDRSEGTTDRLNESDMERFDYFVDQLRQRGVYSNLNLNVFRTYGPNDRVDVPEELGLGKWATHFDPRLIELQQTYARQILTHVNPYTGNTYASEPAVITVEIVNENSLIEGWFNGKLVGKDDGNGSTWSPLPTIYAQRLREQFDAWLPMHRDAKTVAKFRADAGVAPDASLSLLTPEQFAKVSDERFACDFEFIVSTERKFLESMRRLIKDDLGLRSMLVGDADHADGINGYPHMINNTAFDYLDGHGYWQHPSYGTKFKIRRDPMVNDPGDCTIVQFARTPMVGKPFVISETQHPYPHRYAMEGAAITSAYSQLHDWDGLLFHEWGDGVFYNGNNVGKDAVFRVSRDPGKIAGMIVAGAMWHDQAIKPATNRIIRNVTPRQMMDRSRAEPWKQRPFFDQEFPKQLPLVQSTRWQIGDAKNRYPSAPPSNRLIAENDQLRWIDAVNKRGRVIIDSPKAQAIIGFQDPIAADLRPTHLSTDLDNEFAAVVLVPLDRLPIQSSKRLLLHVADRVADIGLKFEEDQQTVSDWGTGPVAITPVQGVVSINGIGSNVTATVLGPLGEPTDIEASVVATSDGVRVTLNEATLMILLERED